MLVYQLPGAFRRLPRPSSPVIAKASITCTSSLDPITVGPQQSGVSRQLSVKTNPARTPGAAKATHVTSVFAPPRRAPFVSHGEARYNSTLRIQNLISPECALPSRIVKELQLSTLATAAQSPRLNAAVAQSIGFRSPESEHGSHQALAPSHRPFGLLTAVF